MNPKAVRRPPHVPNCNAMKKATTLNYEIPFYYGIYFTVFVVVSTKGTSLGLLLTVAYACVSLCKFRALIQTEETEVSDDYVGNNNSSSSRPDMAWVSTICIPNNIIILLLLWLGNVQLQLFNVIVPIMENGME